MSGSVATCVSSSGGAQPPLELEVVEPTRSSVVLSSSQQEGQFFFKWFIR